MTPERLQEIKARCEAATEGPWGLFKEAGADIIGNTEIIILEICCGIRTHATLREFNTDFIAHARQDLPDCLDEIERMKSLVEAAYLEGSSDGDAPTLVWENSDARKALEGTDAPD